MNRLLVGISVVFAAAFSACASLNHPKMDEAEARADIARTLHAHGDAVMRGDPAAAAAVFAEDVRWMPADAADVRGHDSAMALIAKVFSEVGTPRDVWHATEEIYVLGDVAVEIGSVVSTLQPKGQAEIRAHQRYMLMWKRQKDGAWKIFRDMVNNPAPTSVR